jgi:hypothetical protein
MTHQLTGVRRREHDQQDRGHGAEVAAQFPEEMVPAVGLGPLHQQKRVVADVGDRRAEAFPTEQETEDDQDACRPEVGQEAHVLSFLLM